MTGRQRRKYAGPHQTELFKLDSGFVSGQPWTMPYTELYIYDPDRLTRSLVSSFGGVSGGGGRHVILLKPHVAAYRHTLEFFKMRAGGELADTTLAEWLILMRQVKPGTVSQVLNKFTVNAGRWKLQPADAERLQVALQVVQASAA